MAAISALLSGLCLAIGILFRALLGAKDAQIKREQELTNKLLPAVEENTRTLQRLVEVMQAYQQSRLPSPRP